MRRAGGHCWFELKPKPKPKPKPTKTKNQTPKTATETFIRLDTKAEGNQISKSAKENQSGEQGLDAAATWQQAHLLSHFVLPRQVLTPQFSRADRPRTRNTHQERVLVAVWQIGNLRATQ